MVVVAVMLPMMVAVVMGVMMTQSMHDFAQHSLRDACQG